MPSVWTEVRRGRDGKVRNRIVRWQLIVDGERIRGAESCGDSKQFASQREDEIRRDLYAGRSPAPRIKTTSLSALAEEYLANSKTTKAKNTHENFDVRAVRPFVSWFGGGKLPGMIDASVLARWRDEIAKTLKPNTVRMRLRHLSAFFSFAVERDYLSENPFDRAKRTKLLPPAESPARYISLKEIETLLRALPRRQAEAAYFILRTGLRHEELLGLDWKAVRRPGRGPWTAEIARAAAHGLDSGREVKTRRPRFFEIDEEAAAVMGPPRDSGPVFPWRTKTGLGKPLRLAAASTGLGKVRVHDLRHTWATNFMLRNGDPFRLMAEGGWRSMASAAVYQHVRRSPEPPKVPPFSHYFPTKTKNPTRPRKA